MSPILQELGIDRLNKQERLKLIGDIWDSIDSAGEIEIPALHCQELDRRIATADADPSASRPWVELRARLRGEK
jgi:putative addiction module component (TIGR02574 family)